MICDNLSSKVKQFFNVKIYFLIHNKCIDDNTKKYNHNLLEYRKA
jgi:hypothetical protein